MGSYLRTVFFVSCFSFLAFVFLSVGVLAEYSCPLFDGDEQACTFGDAGVVCTWTDAYELCDNKGCWDFSTDEQCSQAANIGLPCEWDDTYSFCEEKSCYAFDGTNENTCVNNVYELECVWTPDLSLCDPPSQSCSDLTTKSDCFSTYYCEWTGTVCEDPDEGTFSSGSTGCFMFNSEAFCMNVTGCNWNDGTSTCDGPSSGLGCEQITESTYCNSVPFLSSCCVWSQGGCDATYSTDCWDNMQDPPTGAAFCEDENAVENQTMCEQIAGPPWYMACRFNADTQRCEFDYSNYFADAYHGSFYDIGSKSTCESAGGVWTTETYVDESGNQIQDSWCEMGFGSQYETCSSACWACSDENSCIGSSLGYCEWDATYDFCKKPDALKQASCSDQTTCENYNYYSNPQTSCDADSDCKWITDPSDNSHGWCAGINAKTCEQTCTECLTSDSCTTSGPNCKWDDTTFLCTSASEEGTGEICFDAIDNDNDNLVDCSDTSCYSDSFCGGTDDENNCGQWETDGDCAAGIECVWLTDPYSNMSWCAAQGTNCWLFDEDEASCDGEVGCVWVDSFYGGDESLCFVNDTFYQNCFNILNEGLCDANPDCSWYVDSYSSSEYCYPDAYTCYTNYYGDEEGCTADSSCTWYDDPFFDAGGYCDSFCYGLDSSACTETPQCQEMTGYCESEEYAAGGCFQFSGNQTACDAKEKCAWEADPNYPGEGDLGWCSDSYVTETYTGLHNDAQPLALDDCGVGSSDASLSDASDMCGFGILDLNNAYGIGAMVDDLAPAALCNGKSLSDGTAGSGTDTASYYFYLDTDGNTTTGCASDDGEQTGFEFYFRYETLYANLELSETKLAYRCLDGAWAVSPISMATWPTKFCSEMNGIFIAVDKETLESYDVFDKTQPLRLYMTSADETNGEDTPDDQIGPSYYTYGSVDFIAEDCYGLVDQDGDGCLPAEDPDCELFNQYGYIPFEDCYNGVDDNFDGYADCNDAACKDSFIACDGALDVDVNDTTPPELALVEMHAYPDGAMVLLETYEPSNATVRFFRESSSCAALNATVVDAMYVSWHSLPLDAFDFNAQALDTSLEANTTYYYKYKLCDVSGNCLASACTNFTTPVSYADCGRNCLTYLDALEFAPPSGQDDETDPLGDLVIRYDLHADGTYDAEKELENSSTQVLINETTLVNIVLTNPDSTEPWAIECVNGTIPPRTTFNASELDINMSVGQGLVGMPTEVFNNQFMADFNCEAIRLTLPFNGNTLRHCENESTGSCVDITDNATKISGTGSGSSGSSTWEVDPELLGFSYYESQGSSSGSSTGGGGGGSSTSTGAITMSGAITLTTSETLVGYKTGQYATFEYETEDHTLTVTQVTASSAVVIVASTPQTFTLRVGEHAFADLDDDGASDLQITLTKISSYRAYLELALLETEEDNVEDALDSSAEDQDLTGAAVAPISQEEISDSEEQAVSSPSDEREQLVDDSSDFAVSGEVQSGSKLAMWAGIVVILGVLTLGVYYSQSRKKNLN